MLWKKENISDQFVLGLVLHYIAALLIFSLKKKTFLIYLLTLHGLGQIFQRPVGCNRTKLS